MNLLEMRQQVRYAINGIDDEFWSDAEINSYLNEGAKVLVAETQPLQSFFQKALVSGQQEYVLPADFDEEFTVQIHDGVNNYDVYPIHSSEAQQSNAWSGRPTYFYLRKDVASRYDQDTTTSNITETSLGLGPNAGRSVIGFTPIPDSSSYTLNLFYFSKHFQMVNDSDVSPVDVTFHRAMIAYAAALCKQKDDSYGEFSFHMDLFSNFKKGLRKKAVARGLTSFSKVRCVEDTELQAGSSVIFLNDASYGS